MKRTPALTPFVLLFSGYGSGYPGECPGRKRCCGAPALVSWQWNLVFTIGFAALAIAGILLETQELLLASEKKILTGCGLFYPCHQTGKSC